jgi:hypothetical protein
MASGLLNSSRQIGGSVGLAALVTVAASATASSGGAPGRAALATGYATVFAAAAALLLAAALTALVLLPGRPAVPTVAGPAPDPEPRRAVSGRTGV